jgi:hypothetical protein
VLASANTAATTLSPTTIQITVAKDAWMPSTGEV